MAGAASSIRDVSTGIDELLLELSGPSGEPLAMASSQGSLTTLQGLGLDRSDVHAIPPIALKQWVPNAPVATALVALESSKAQPSRVAAGWLYSRGATITVGSAWCDTSTGATGPEDVPSEVHERLRAEGARGEPLTGASPELLRALVNCYVPARTR